MKLWWRKKSEKHQPLQLPQTTLTKKVKDLYHKNFESLKKEIKEDTRKWIGMLLDRQNQHSKNGTLAKSNLQIQCNPHQNPTQFFTDLERKKSQLYMEKQKTQDSQNNPVQ